MLHQLARLFFVVHADGLVVRQKGPGFSSRTLNTAAESGPGRPGSAGIDYIRVTGGHRCHPGLRDRSLRGLTEQGISLDVFTKQ